MFSNTERKQQQQVISHFSQTGGHRSTRSPALLHQPYRWKQVNEVTKLLRQPYRWKQVNEVTKLLHQSYRLKQVDEVTRAVTPDIPVETGRRCHQRCYTRHTG